MRYEMMTFKQIAEFSAKIIFGLACIASGFIAVILPLVWFIRAIAPVIRGD